MPGAAGPRADRAAGLSRAARRSSMTTCARSGRCSTPPRTFQRTVYRPGRDLPVRSLGAARRRSRSGTARRAAAGSWSACLGYSRAGAGALVFSKQTPDLLFGIRPLPVVAGRAAARRWSGTARPALHAGGGRPTEAFAGVLRAAARSAGISATPATRRPRASSSACRTSWSASFEPGPARSPTSSTSSCSSTRWFDERANARMHKTLRAARSTGCVEEREVMAPLPATPPDIDRRWVLRVPPDPYLRFDTCDYSLDPRPGRPPRRGPRHPARGHWRSRWTPASSPAGTPRSFARHRTITALEHARALQDAARRAPRRRRRRVVEVRSLAAYDALIA